MSVSEILPEIPKLGKGKEHEDKSAAFEADQDHRELKHILFFCYTGVGRRRCPSVRWIIQNTADFLEHYTKATLPIFQKLVEGKWQRPQKKTFHLGAAHLARDTLTPSTPHPHLSTCLGDSQ